MPIIYDLGTNAARLCLPVISADEAWVENADVRSSEGKGLELGPGTWHRGLGTWNVEYGTWVRDSGSGQPMIYDLGAATWDLGLRTWGLGPGTWHLGPETWNHGIRILGLESGT